MMRFFDQVYALRLKCIENESDAFEFAVPPRRRITAIADILWGGHMGIDADFKLPEGVLAQSTVAHKIEITIHNNHRVDLDIPTISRGNDLDKFSKFYNLHLISRGVILRTIKGELKPKEIPQLPSKLNLALPNTESNDVGGRQYKPVAKKRCTCDPKSTVFNSHPYQSASFKEEMWSSDWLDDNKSVWDDSIDTFRFVLNVRKSVYENLALDDFLQSTSFSDVTIVCGNQIFPTHRIILSCQSPVFRCMLESDMKEGNEGQIVIDDMEPKTVQELLRYIYVGSDAFCPALKVELLYAAEKYQMINLKNLCVQELFGTIRVETALNVYDLGVMYKSPKLCFKALDLMKMNKDHFVGTAAKLKNLCNKDPDLAFKIANA